MHCLETEPITFSPIGPRLNHTSEVSPKLLDLVVMEKPDWTFRDWTSLWSSIFGTH